MKRTAFLKQLAVLINSGITLIDALKIIKYQGQSELKIEDIILQIEAGKSFSEALCNIGKYEKYISIFRIAEKEGQLNFAILRVVEQMEKEKELADKVKKSLAYPAIVLAIGLLCVLFLIFFILPNFSQLFADLNYSLPPATKILLSLPGYGVFFAAAVFFIALFMFKILKDEDFKLKIPFLGKILLSFIAGNLCVNLGSQLKSGVPIVESLIACKTKSKRLNNFLNDVIKNIQMGESLSKAFSKGGIFSKDIIHIIKVGEASGTIDKMLISAGGMLNEQAESAIKGITLFIEPAATLTVGVLVGFIAFAMISPLFSIMNSIL